MFRMNCDYLEGCHAKVLEALISSNMEQHPGYGMDEHCAHAAEMIRARFECPESDVHFLVGGTQVNTTVIAAILRPWEGVLSADTGHINVHETGAIESSGHKVLTLPEKDGKITGDQVREAVHLQADSEHTVKPGMVYISMTTEVGTLYSAAELTDLYAACRECNLPLYIDGARLGYALASPENDITPAFLACHCDAFTIGGTKVGALFGEALVINPTLCPSFRYMIKQRGGMLAKGRLLGVQFEALMADDLYFAIGKKADEQALAIRSALEKKGIPFLVQSPSNQQFAIFTNAQAEKIAENFVLEDNGRIDADHICLRVCTSWATTDEMVDALIQTIETL